LDSYRQDDFPSGTNIRIRLIPNYFMFLYPDTALKKPIRPSMILAFFPFPIETLPASPLTRPPRNTPYSARS
jgi:hypothetical protein